MSKIRILLIGPRHHGMGQQISVFHQSLNDHPRVAYCDWVGSENHYFSSVLIWKKARQIIKNVNFSLYDVVNLHYGKLEIEQIIPILLQNKKENLPPFIYSVHSLRGDLFERLRQTPNPLLQEKINQVTRNFFDGYIYYGNYAAQKWVKPGRVIFIHEQYSHIKLTKEESTHYQKTFFIPTNYKPFLVLAGYASPWKDWNTLLKSFRWIKTPLRFLFAGPGWKKKLKFKKKKIGKVEIYVIDKHLDEKEFSFLIKSATFGCFPYQDHESFQGSGILPNYLYLGKPCIATQCANLPEMVGKAGIIVPQHNPLQLAKAINSFLNSKNLFYFEKQAKSRSYLFSRVYHVAQCLDYFNQIARLKKYSKEISEIRC